MGEDVTYVTTRCPHPHAPLLCPASAKIEQFEASCGYPIKRIQNTLLGSGRWLSLLVVLSRFSLIWNLHRMASRKRVEYIVVNQSTSLSVACWLVAKAARIPIIQIVHHLAADMGSGIGGRLRKWLIRLALRRVSVNVCVSNGTVSDVASFGRSDRVRTTVIPNALDLKAIDDWRGDAEVSGESAKLLQERGYPKGRRPVIFTVGRLYKHKGIHLVIRAMGRILNEFPETRYVVAGDGIYRSELESIAYSVLPASYREAVVFLGFVSDDEKYALYEACDLFVMPSSEEGFGLVYAEAGAFGKPSIGCDVMGVPEAIAHEETGLLVPPNDADAVAEAILRLLRNDTERARMGAAARQRVESMGTWEDRAREYQQLIGELTAKRGRRK